MRGEVTRLSVDVFLSYGPVRSVVFEAEIHPTKFAEKGRVRWVMKAGVREAEERGPEAAVCDGKTSEWRARVRGGQGGQGEVWGSRCR